MPCQAYVLTGVKLLFNTLLVSGVRIRAYRLSLSLLHKALISLGDITRFSIFTFLFISCFVYCLGVERRLIKLAKSINFLGFPLLAWDSSFRLVDDVNSFVIDWISLFFCLSYILRKFSCCGINLVCGIFSVLFLFFSLFTLLLLFLIMIGLYFGSSNELTATRLSYFLYFFVSFIAFVFPFVSCSTFAVQ